MLRVKPLGKGSHVFREPPNAERNRQPDDDHVHQQSKNQVVKFVKAPRLKRGERQNDQHGIPEELIDRFSKIPGLRVLPPTSSFCFKGKRIPIADMAKALSVVYLLDGIVRRSGARMRVAA